MQSRVGQEGGKPPNLSGQFFDVFILLIVDPPFDWFSSLSLLFKSMANAESRPLHEQFEAQAAATPHALAVVDGSCQWTYAELELLTRRLAVR